MKYIRLFSILICIAMLSGCNIPQAEDKDKIIDKSIFESASEKISERTPSVPKAPSKTQDVGTSPTITLDLDTEKGIREYLVGEWVFEMWYLSDVVCNMRIDKDLNATLSFYDPYTDENNGDYKGKIAFDRIYADPNEAPDLLCFELDGDYPGGDFYFLHRTIYDGKRVMSLFPASNGNNIFDMLGTEDNPYLADDIVFEKVTGEESQLHPYKNKEFYAFCWGVDDDEKKLWIDDVLWTSQDDNYARMYPPQMANFKNDIRESVFYSIAPDRIMDVLEYEIYQGNVYLVRTNEHGEIVGFDFVA